LTERRQTQRDAATCNLFNIETCRPSDDNASDDAFDSCIKLHRDTPMNAIREAATTINTCYFAVR